MRVRELLEDVALLEIEQNSFHLRLNDQDQAALSDPATKAKKRVSNTPALISLFRELHSETRACHRRFLISQASKTNYDPLL
jgi:hypothetical protein